MTERPLKMGARVNAKGQNITVPAPDRNADRLALKKWSWEVGK